MRSKHREKAWSEFVAWCRTRRLKPLPAHPWTVAAYARWCESRHRYANIVTRIRAIARVHLLSCTDTPDRHPTVTRTLRMIEIRHRGKAQRAALFSLDDVGGEAGWTKAAAKVSRQRRLPRGLRQSPRLVSRRPRGD